MGDLVTDSYNIWVRRTNYLFQLLNVNDVRQTELHTAEPLVPEPSAFDVDMAVGKLKKDTNHQVPIKLQHN
jgi:hypothetical protein